MWKIFNKETPGKEYRDPKDPLRSVIMTVAMCSTGGPLFGKGRWNYDLECPIFFPEDPNFEPIELMMHHTKLWIPYSVENKPEITDELWNSAFPAIQSSKET